MKPHVPRTLLFSIGLMVAAAAGAQGRHEALLHKSAHQRPRRSTGKLTA